MVKPGLGWCLIRDLKACIFLFAQIHLVTFSQLCKFQSGRHFAVLYALEWLQQNGVSHVIIETDCKQVVDIGLLLIMELIITTKKKS